MSPPQGLLLEAATGWRLVTGQRVQVCSPAEDAGAEEGLAILACLREISTGPWKLIVAPSAGSTITARLTPSDVAGRRVFTQETLAFAVEEHLPWAAEEFTVHTTSRTPGSLALALLTDRWERLFGQLRQNAHTVCACVPAALLMREALLQAIHFPENAGLLFRDDDGIQLIKHQAGAVVDWKFWPVGAANADDARLLVAEIATDHPLDPIHNFVNDGGLTDVLKEFDFDVVEHTSPDDSRDELLWRGTQRFWKPRSASINLAVGRLAGTTHRDVCVGAVRSVLMSVIVVCCVLAGLLWWKSAQLQQLAERRRADQVVLFQQTFPETPVPGAVSARFDSEHRRLVGERGGAGEVELPAAALAGLQVILTAHQTPLRSQFDEINITDELVEIEAKFRNHEDAARMVDRLEQSGLRIDPPQLQKLDERRFGTRLRGRLQPQAKGNG